jgi:hypothetical protein
LFTPLDEADYNWPAEDLNALVAPRQSDTPARLRRGYRLHRLPARWADQVPDPLPVYAGQIHAVRCVDETGSVRFLNEPIRIGIRYIGRYAWLTLDPGHQQLTVWYQANADAEADWRQLKVRDYLLEENVLPVPQKFARLHT